MTYLSFKYKYEQLWRSGAVVLLGFNSSNIHLLPGNRFSTWGIAVSNTFCISFLIRCQEFKLVKAGDWQKGGETPPDPQELFWHKFIREYGTVIFTLFVIFWVVVKELIYNSMTSTPTSFFEKMLNKQRLDSLGDARSCHSFYIQYTFLDWNHFSIFLQRSRMGKNKSWLQSTHSGRITPNQQEYL